MNGRKHETIADPLLEWEARDLTYKKPAATQDLRYRVIASSKWNWRSFDTVRLEISVGKDYHEGKKLAAAMDWARSNFKDRFIILGDTAQRYNFMFEHELDEKTAYTTSKKQGDEWLKRNKQHLHGISVTRWDEWRDLVEYDDTKKQVMYLHKNNKIFQEQLTQEREGFWARQGRPESEKARFVELSTKYLLEETVVFALAYKKLHGISAYPGTFLSMVRAFLDQECNDPLPEGFLISHCVRLNFKRRKNKDLIETA